MRLPLSSEFSEQRSDSSSDETTAVERGSAAGESEGKRERRRQGWEERGKLEGDAYSEQKSKNHMFIFSFFLSPVIRTY